MSKPIYDVCVRLRELGIDYNLARAMLDMQHRHGQLTPEQLVDFEVLWPQTRAVKPLEGKWVGFNY
jgi:hypothetical protein